MHSATDQFRDAIRSAGLIPPDMIEPDGKLHRFASNGKNGDDAGWYALHGDGIPAGTFGDWRNGFSQTWRADIGRKLTPAEGAAHRAKVEAMQRERDDDKAKTKREAKAKAAAIWNSATAASDNHAYLIRKQIKSSGARTYKGALVIPMHSDGEIQSLQFINADGIKKFLTGGQVKGCFFIVGNFANAAALCIAEGFATAATIHEATGLPVVAAPNAARMARASGLMWIFVRSVVFISCLPSAKWLAPACIRPD